MGAVPPLSDRAWQTAFEAYQKIPEYTELKAGMSLDAFKAIYWWEWAHRFLGRFIGLVFFVPFIGFWLAGYIPRAMLPRLIGLFALGGLQGAVGWYMVKSGLVDRTDVSQYRLAAHLGIAVAILGYTLWLLFDLGGHAGEGATGLAGAVLGRCLGARADLSADPGRRARRRHRCRARLQHLAGDQRCLRARGLGALSPWYLNLFENPLTVQFDHRMLAYAVLLAALAQTIWLARRPRSGALAASALFVACLSVLQATLGVWTLLLAVPISLGLAHQLGAMAVFAAAVHHLWLARQPAIAVRDVQTAASA